MNEGFATNYEIIHTQTLAAMDSIADSYEDLFM